jgi:hypothetical protein
MIGRRISVPTILLLLAGAVHAMAQRNLSNALQVSLSNARLNHRVLSFTWHIVNHSSEPLYVYSTFLKGPAAAEMVRGDTLQVRTSLRVAEAVGVNAYPRAMFSRLEPGGTLDGKFVEKQMDDAAFSRASRVELEVAFGKDPEALKREIAEASRNGRHPANPIVRWQTEAIGTAPLAR